MNPTGKVLSWSRIYPAAACVLLAASACNSGPSVKKTEEKSAEQNSASATQNSDSSGRNKPDPGIDLNCVVDRIQNPPEAFHYSYKKDGSNSVDEEAEVTPQTIEGTFKNNDISRAVHGVRSDKDGWQMAWASLMGISGMSSTFALVRNSSAMVREGTEKVNGYDSIRYSIDTARSSAAETALYGARWGPVVSKGAPFG